MMFCIFIFNLIISSIWCQNIERILLSRGELFSFNCQNVQSIYFSQQLNQWKEIKQNDENNLDLNINFKYLSDEDIVKVSIESIEEKHVGFYACQYPSMNSIYQLILGDVRSFYWNYVCHGPIGSCQRTDDLIDENLSKFEVCDKTDIELFCCASVTGYKNVNIRMNSIGENFNDVQINKRQGNDGSWVVCANQRTLLRRTPYTNQQTLTCELYTDNKIHSTLSSMIILKDPISRDPSIDYNVYLQDNQGNKYFDRPGVFEVRSRRKLTTGRKIAIIVGSVLGGLFLLGLLSCLIILMCRNKKDALNSKKKDSNKYSPVQTSEKSNYKDSKSDEHVYEEPTQLNDPPNVFFRC